MNRNTIQSQQSSGTDPAFPALPVVTSRERDFWRRAVAEQRQRLELTGHEAPPELRAERH
jgi:hypothetical protein